MGRGPERAHPGRARRPDPTAGRGWHGSSACSSCPSRPASAWPATACSHWSGAAVRSSCPSWSGRSASRPPWRDPGRPGRAVGRRGDRHRLVPPVAGRPARRLRRVRGRRRAQHAARPRRRDPQAPERRDPRDPRRQRGVGAGRYSLLYSRYPVGDQYNRRIYRHVSGEPWADDELVWADLPTPESWADVATSPDGRFVLVTALVGWSRTDSTSWTSDRGVADDHRGRRRDHLRPVRRRPAGRGHDARAPRAGWSPSPSTGTADPRQWTTLVPEGEGVVEHAVPVAGGLLVVTTHSAADRITCHGPTAPWLGEVDLPELCTWWARRRGRPVAGLRAARGLHPSGEPVPLERRPGWSLTGAMITTTCSVPVAVVAVSATSSTRRHRDRAVRDPSRRRSRPTRTRGAS